MPAIEPRVNLFTHYSILYLAGKNLWYFRCLWDGLPSSAGEFYFNARINFLQISILKLHTLYSESKSDKYSFSNLFQQLYTLHPEFKTDWANLKEMLGAISPVYLPNLKIMRHRFIAHLDPNRNLADKDMKLDDLKAIVSFGETFFGKN